MQQINSTTFTANGLGDVKPDVTIGGKDKAKFIPNINMSYHNDEFFINLNRRDKIAITSAVDGKAESGGIDKDIFHIDDQGRFKWDIEFASRPAVNSWAWELKHTKGIEFYYQGELTPEEIADGCERPEEVVGSYAVYCNKANNKYKTGKLCHIYRPFCYDTKENTIYADLKIADGKLTITIDETWLDNAIYPVRLDPTIGYTSAGASSVNSKRYLHSPNINVTMPEDGTSAKVYAYLRGSNSDNTTLFGYYSDDSGVPDSLIDGNNSVTVNSSTPAWYNSSVSGNLSSGVKYYPSVMINPELTGANYIYYDSGGSSWSSIYRSTGLSYMPDIYGSAIGSTNLRSIYLEYTESGGSSSGLLVGQSALVGGGVLCGQGNLIN